MILFKNGVEYLQGDNLEVSEKLSSGEKASYVLVALSSGRASLKFDISGPGADLSLKGLYICSGEDRLSLKIDTVHSCGGSVSDQVVRGVLSGHSHAQFDGLVKVNALAQKTEAYQNCRNLLLSNDAIGQILPQLEIYADDVKCSHGATCGSLDENETFYMRSRGISEEQARRLQILSFISPVLDSLGEDSPIKKEILECL